MSTIYVKLRMKENTNKYRKMLSTDEKVYATISELVETSCDYTPGAILEGGEWFRIEKASQQPYSIEPIMQKYDSVDYDSMVRSDFNKIDYLFVENGTTLSFQNITRTKLATKKRIGSFGEKFRYESNSEEIVINEYPDAIYCSDTDILYFRKLEPIVGIFKGIADLYREATNEETEQFLQSDFITLKDDYGTTKVKTANRKRIALAVKTLSELSPDEKKNIFSYIGEYCPDLKTEEDTFSVSNEEELKMVLFGIEQRFYTTPVGGEKRIANSVLIMNR